MSRIGRLTALLALALAAGCGQGALTHDEQVEALRAEVRRLQDELWKAEQRVPTDVASADTPAPAPPAADPFRALAIRFGKHTGVPASSPDRLKVVLEPLDGGGDVVKRAGSLVLEARLPGKAGPPAAPYHTWRLPAADLAQTWIGSLGIRGYVLKLPWPGGRPPEAEALLLRACLTTLDGRALDAETRVPLGEAR